MKSDTHEEWRYIKETGRKYSVSNQGRVKNNINGNILKAINTPKGYTKVNLHMDNGLRYSRLIHRLVATAFIPNSENKPEVNHKNGIKHDNRVENLEWVTQEENLKHAYDTGLVRHKDNCYSGYLYSLWKRVHQDKMCSEWQDFLVFREWCILHGYENGLTIVRFDDRKEYSPDNCRVSHKVQHSKANISKRKNVFMCFGKMMPIEDISEMFGIEQETLRYRIKKKGMTAEEAVKMPLCKNGRPRKEDVCEQLTIKKITTCESA